MREEREAVVAAGPVVADDVWSSATDHAAEDEADDDGVVGIAEDGDEVGDEVDGDREVAKEEVEADAGTTMQVAVAGEAMDEADGVRQDPHGIAERGVGWAQDGVADQEDQPQHDEGSDDAGDDGEAGPHGCSVAATSRIVALCGLHSLRSGTGVVGVWAFQPS